MNKYLIKYGWTSFVFNNDAVKETQVEFDSLDSAIEHVERIELKVLMRGTGGVHRAGWPYTTLKKTPNGLVRFSGVSPAGYDPSLVATIYEIETDGLAQQVYDEWHAEQKRITETEIAEAVTMAVDAFKARGLDLEGHLTFDGDVYSGERWKLGEAFLLNMFEFLIPPQARDEKINFGRVRVTVEPLEVESGEE